jgi:hypothetical protein
MQSAIVLVTLLVPTAYCQEINKLFVEVRTEDKAFAGTDDPVDLQLGGQPFHLDDPDKDDRERGNTDEYEIDVPGGRLTIELIRAVGSIAVVKLEDSFWGGGWDFGGIRVWANVKAGTPLYENMSINKSLDDGHLEWHADLDDSGWSLPEPAPPFPPCVLGDIDLGIEFDSDCDGIPDSSDPVFDPVDSDGDGIPDPVEENAGTDPLSADSDGDGWWDAMNRRYLLLVTRIKCFDEAEDAGRDELYITAEDARYPLAPDLDGSWPMDDGSEIFPGLIVDSRVAQPAAAGNPNPVFHTRLKLREGDPTVVEGPTDDTYKQFSIDWGESHFETVVHDASDEHYEIDFRSVMVTFPDPDPVDPLADDDEDGLTESKEFAISQQLPSAEPAVIDGYNGLADPGWREVFVEVDSVGPGNRLNSDAKQMVVSQFFNHNISMRLDDGYLGGGDVVPYRETISLQVLQDEYRDEVTDTIFSSLRAEHYRYGLMADRVQGEGSFGVGSFTPTGGFAVGHLRIAGIDFGHTMVAEYTPILVMHELGHTFNLCHRAGDKGETAPNSCPATPGMRCGRYCAASDTEFVNQSSNTAMGSDTTWDLIVELGIAPIIAAGAGVALSAVIGFLLGGPLGAVIGGIFGGLILGIFVGSQADVFQRLVNYHWIEWVSLRFWT